ncbi:MAG: alpha/beta hydrolase-fold protein [Chitinophagales bacterium]
MDNIRVRKFTATIYFCLLFHGLLNAQVTFIVTNANDFPDSIKNNIYVAGNFNGWNPADKKYLVKNSNGIYSLTVTPPKDITSLEYKFTHGSWLQVEVHSDGSQTQNRTNLYKPGMIIETKVEGWDDLKPDKLKKGNKDVIQFSVYSEELKREKNIRVYLPCDYETSGKKYPVLYMLDGQNLFDDVYSPAGEWGIDETMDSLCELNFETSIVVGIDHAGEMRLSEYSPWKIKKYVTSGEGDAFAEFIVNTLKRKIDASYRTNAGREFTAIAGSSMGGLMSLYFVLNYNQTFGKAAVFSPAFWTNNGNFSNAEKFSSNLPTKIYFIAGAKEGNEYTYMFDMQRMYNLLLKKQLPSLEMRIIVESDGQHTESFWRREFDDAYLWLMENNE